MEHKRQFIIKIVDESKPYNLYIMEIFKHRVGYFYIRTKNSKKAKSWKFRKSCENMITKIQENLDPTRAYLSINKLEVFEITDKQILREIKIKKLNKK